MDFLLSICLTSQYVVTEGSGPQNTQKRANSSLSRPYTFSPYKQRKTPIESGFFVVASILGNLSGPPGGIRTPGLWNRNRMGGVSQKITEGRVMPRKA